MPDTPQEKLTQLIDSLTRALCVLYHGSDEHLTRLAENEFSGCASTQREHPTELNDYLNKTTPERNT